MRTSPIHTLREGGVCREHGAVGSFTEEQVLNLAFPPKTVFRSVDNRVLPAPEKNSGHMKEVYGADKDWSDLGVTEVAEKRVVRKQKKPKVQKTMHPVDAMDTWQFRIALAENVVHTMRKVYPNAPVFLSDISEQVAEELDMSEKTMYVRFCVFWPVSERIALGIVHGGKRKGRKRRTTFSAKFDTQRFVVDFEEVTRFLPERTFDSETWQMVLGRYRSLGEQYFWTDSLDPMCVSDAVTFACETLRMSEEEVAAIARMPLVRLQEFRALRSLIPFLQNMLGHKVPEQWRIKVRDALKIALLPGPEQLDGAKHILWVKLKWRYRRYRKK